MNKKTFTFLIAALFMIKATAQQVEQKQRTLITKVTATWCSSCGSWGWDLFEGLIDDNAEKAVLLTARSSGNFTTEASNDIVSNLGSVSQPRFYVNETNQNASSGNSASKRTAIKDMVDEAFNSQMPVANVGFAPAFGDNKITVNAKVKFFQPADGEYYLSVYLIDNNLMGNQSGQSGSVQHKRVIVDNFSESTWGELIANGSISADTEFDISYELPISEVAGYEYEVAGIIWKKDGDKYTTVNVWSTTEIGEASDVKDINGISSFEITPNITSDQAVIQLDLDNNLTNASLDIFNIQGQLITTIQKGHFNKGHQVFNLNKSMVDGNGLYFVRLTDGKNVSTRRLMIND